MYQIDIMPIPNQRFRTRIEDALFEITLKAVGGGTVASISRDDVILARGVRCVPGKPLVPYAYMEGATGNFYFVTSGGDYPHYSRFGSKDTLWYLTRAELEEKRSQSND